jgi:hypothetical protein
VKIIRNMVDAAAVYKTACQRCHSELEVAAEDFKKDPTDDRDGLAYIYVCPCCLAENWVNADRIPNGIRLRVTKTLR